MTFIAFYEFFKDVPGCVKTFIDFREWLFGTVGMQTFARFQLVSCPLKTYIVFHFVSSFFRKCSWFHVDFH